VILGFWRPASAVLSGRVQPDSRLRSINGRSGENLIPAIKFLQVTPEPKVTAFTLPYGTDAFPSNLVAIDHRFYFGIDEEVDVSGSDEYRDMAATISSRGKIKTLYRSTQ